MLIINADDWGMTSETTDRIHRCYLHGVIDSASAMVFMSDSKRSAALASKSQLPVGLHVNFTEPFSQENVSAALQMHLCRVTSFLTRHRVSQVIYNPLLSGSFEYLLRAQVDEYCRLYGVEPMRIDGHHHMHLCANSLLSRKLRRGIWVRRSFSFAPREKGLANWVYRAIVNGVVRFRFQTSDHFFSIVPIQRSRVERIVALAEDSDVELMVHPGLTHEYEYLLSDEWLALLDHRHR